MLRLAPFNSFQERNRRVLLAGFFHAEMPSLVTAFVPCCDTLVSSYKVCLQAAQHGTFCLALWLSEGHLLTGKDQGKGGGEDAGMNLPPLVSLGYFCSLLEVSICVYNMHTGIPLLCALGAELSEQITGW